jgi:hypothetical protein
MARPGGEPVTTELATLEDEERILALRRQTIQRQVNDMFVGATLNEDQLVLLNKLEQHEREISRERRKLHARIAHLRAGLGLPQHQRFTR